MEAMLCEPVVRERRRRSRVHTVLRVQEAGRHVGDVLLDERNRVWRHADTIPADVVLKALLAHSRQDVTGGDIVSRSDGRTYRWRVVGD